MKKVRIWHASRDPYHACFRILRILLATPDTHLQLEWLRILDLFLLQPPLLHRTSLPMELKDRLRGLSISHPDHIFIRLPSAAALFQTIRLYQNVALSQLAARSIIDKTRMLNGEIALDISKIPQNLATAATNKNQTEFGLVGLLVDILKTMPLSGAEGIYRKARLPARGLAA